jgi:hypothetical protein
MDASQAAADGGQAQVLVEEQKLTSTGVNQNGNHVCNSGAARRDKQQQQA